MKLGGSVPASPPPSGALAAPTVRLLSGASMPLLGLGTWACPPGVIQKAVDVALDHGYRHFDCAYFYQNEEAVGEVVRRRIKERGVRREDLFIVSKLWNIFHDPGDVRPAFLSSLRSWKLDHLDLYLMHSPMAFQNRGGELLPLKNGLRLQADVDYLDTWKAMERLVEEGLVRAIGVSNFNVAQLQRLLGACSIRPEVNQVELHPYLTQTKLVEFCQSQKIVLTAYSPLGGPAPALPPPPDGPRKVLEAPTVKEIARRHGKQSAQVLTEALDPTPGPIPPSPAILIRYHLQRGICAIPKSATPSRIVANAQVTDFSLSPEEMEALGGLNRNQRAMPWDSFGIDTHRHYPFADDEQTGPQSGGERPADHRA
ncbi:aldo-keto reductase family 1 member B7-like [Tachyglossus aculeatus]|uniref:aldo-keto reductase family 1 member B7-like n=1 Tax=Tachyglossus aculeatus TaxID=9261 RepID=UPI0018F49ABD|nr:aldo-keto reductase family 1 member B7-like [Tachyglossus aculeatus]